MAKKKTPAPTPRGQESDTPIFDALVTIMAAWGPNPRGTTYAKIHQGLVEFYEKEPKKKAGR